MGKWVKYKTSFVISHTQWRDIEQAKPLSETTWTCKYGKSVKWQIMISFNFLISASSNQTKISSWNPQCTSKLWWLLFDLIMKLKNSEYVPKCNDSTKNEANFVLNATTKCETFSVNNYFVRCIRNVDSRIINDVMHKISKNSLRMDQQFCYSFRKHILYVFSQGFFCPIKLQSRFYFSMGP